MAEVKNSFLKSKMNQDLDDRLIPNGEYRYANNISVGKSETDDIGSLKNVLGNEILPLTEGTGFPGLECIGAFMDNQNNRIFQFLTNYTDPNPNLITSAENIGFEPDPEGWVMKIVMYDFDNPTVYITLVEGLFLNFAKNKEFRITGVNLVEGLLFWTDNRNQPRKINVANAIVNANYYTTEDQISVAKYAPIEPISLYRKVTQEVTSVSSGLEFEVVSAAGIVKGMTVISENMSGSEYIIVTEVDYSNNIVFLYKEPSIPIVSGDELTFLISTMSDKSDVPSWPGDPAFLEDKYVRFSYRFKYDDNEYSLMAPFTQIAYIPKQKGYFIDGNETDAYRSTVINWFENNVNNIELIVPFPDKVGNLTNSYKIVEIDILYKESDSTAVKVFETIPISAINTLVNSNNNFYVQPYQSQKPYKTLPEDQTTRVYDKVPVRARAQESAGNRIIYGNYYDKYTCLSSINYNISVQPKSTTGTNFIEYPNHTLKRNRNYQVGFVLADKFGRQSPVILSSVDLLSPTIDGVKTKGSTVYSSYENTVLFDDVRSWFGDALILYLNAPINQDRYMPSGQPGLYAIPTSNFGFAITALTQTGVNQYVFTIDITTLDSQYVPVVGNILRGKYVDYVKVLNSVPIYQTPGDPLTPIVSVTITTSGEINDIYNYSDPGGGLADIKFAYNYNPVGWYSYKVVVKQQEQDYYNVYLPGMLNGYPKNQTSGSQVTYDSAGVASMQTGVNTTQFPVSETGKTSHIVLINDNINKVPRDLSEVGPDQKQYRSSIQLYGRVENTKATLNIVGNNPEYSAKVTTIEYSTLTVGNEDWALIKPGDGIQCVEASIPVDDTTPPATAGATMPNPYRWLGNTVVVSNVVVGTTGTITISSPNWVLGGTGAPIQYKNFIITRAENVQYFPTRKADTVISIATADEFNFIDSSEDNLSGTAGLNFYQLQNKPLIGRVSTTNDIGVIAADMIPFLSVYETRAEQSLLEIFWETATTGLISDLNADVLTGFNGPSGFGNFEYKHFENQNPNGTDTDPNNYGQPNSKYITDLFYVINQNGVILPNTTVTLTNVVDGNGNNRLLDFGIEASNDGTNNLYRLFIKPPPTGSPFVFNYQPPFIESYTFTFNVVDIDDQSTASELVINGRLGNIAPEITTIQTNYNITQNTTTFVTLEANNGSFTEAITGLKWTINSGDPGPYFLIDPVTGALKLNDDQIPLGVYNLEIKVQDAVNTSDGQPLLPINTDFGSKSSTKNIIVNVGDEPVPYWLRPNYESSPIQSQAVCGSVSANDAGFVYIGPVANPSSTYFPTIPGFSGTYDIIENIEVENAENYSLNNIQPTGLREGEYRVSVKLDVFAIPICPVFPTPTTSSSFAKGKAKIYLYRRIYTAAGTNVWALVNNENNFGISPVYEIGPLSVSTFDDGSGPIAGPTKSLTTSFTIQASDTIDEVYEYAIGFKLESEFNNADGLNGPKITVYGNDANYAYSIPPALPVQPFSPPIANEYEYYTGVVDFATSYTSGVPYTTQDATRGIDYNSPTNAIASGTANAGVELVILTLSSVNNQIVSGMECGLEAVGYNIGFPIFGTIAYVNPANPAEITLQLNTGWPYQTTPLDLGNLRVKTTVFDPLLPIGKLYANTVEGTEIRRFYTDANFTQKWIPPVADRFYNFITSKNYNPEGVAFQPSGILKYSEFPYYCAFVKGDGEIALQTGTTPNVQTAWSGQNPQNTLPIDIANYSYNVLYTETPAP